MWSTGAFFLNWKSLELEYWYPNSRLFQFKKKKNTVPYFTKT